MEELNTTIIGFVAQHLANPLPHGASTREYMVALRTYLDAYSPGWRERALEGAPVGKMAIVVEFRLGNGRKIRGTLAQRPSRVRGGNLN